jgi:hypothetical protein
MKMWRNGASGRKWRRLVASAAGVARAVRAAGVAGVKLAVLWQHQRKRHEYHGEK